MRTFALLTDSIVYPSAMTCKAGDLANQDQANQQPRARRVDPDSGGRLPVRTGSFSSAAPPTRICSDHFHLLISAYRFLWYDQHGPSLEAARRCAGRTVDTARDATARRV